VCYWIEFVLAVHGGLGNAAGWAVFVLFPLAKGLHMAVFALLAGFPMRRWWAIPGVAALWVAIEATHVWLGFAWLALGNAGIDMGVPMRLAPITGVHGLSMVFAMMAAGLALGAMRRKRRELAWLAALAGLLLLPALPDAKPGSETALLLQPNISETEEWTTDSVDRMQQELASLTLTGALAERSQPPSLLVWPEVPAPLYFYEDARFRGYAQALARATRAHLLLGVVAHTKSGAPLNSATLLSPAGAALARYDKVHLVPFGEFVPWPFGFAESISSEVGNFQAGSRVVVPAAGTHRLGAFICYESVFPNFVRQFVAGGAEVLVNISNDGWFGKSAARAQHLTIARMRAAENRRWLLRATNDGITATIDPAGRLRGTLPSYVQATSYTGFDYISERTLYTRFGDWFAAMCASIAALCLIVERMVDG
jgi:apolipoprotein N-acyltransferase